MDTTPTLRLLPSWTRPRSTVRPMPAATQGGLLDEFDEPARPDRARFTDQMTAQTSLIRDTETWIARCVHGRRDVTWFRTQLTPADHQECGCGE
jgi:hypothetical protein